MQLFKEIFKPLFRYFNDASYREYIRVKGKCRRTPEGKRISIDVQGFSIETANAKAFLHLYEEIVAGKAFDIELQSTSPLIICAGANIGLEVFLLSKKIPGGRIIAFEADPQYAQLLRKNLVANHVKNVEFTEAAVWTGNGKIPFASDGALGGKAGENGTDVKAIDFREELLKHISIDLLLMDVEGAEFNIIEHCREELGRIKNMFVEWHGKENQPQRLPEFLDILSAAGFRYRIDNKLPLSPFRNSLTENGFDAMAGIYLHRPA